MLAVYDNGTPHVVSELLEGQSLRVRLEGGGLPVSKAVDYALQVAHGLAAAHDTGMKYLKIDPPLDPLCSDPRFDDLLRRMNFPS